ncbi:MAG: CCA tRNA nucleotidyltransferase [Lachnospiraceae bacterium]|nr:CCA tRNA nucleotidyltransferase [Lachnospiraceae bacterium]
MQLNLPNKVSLIIDTLQAGGYEAYAVGGCVRDSLMGRKPKDWDITTNAKPVEIKRLFKRTVDTGIQHGTVTVLFGKESYELTTYRIDGIYEDKRHPKEVTFTGDLAKDLERRDFTINAMAYNDKEGLVDLFKGLEDLGSHTIKAVGNPLERFDEDALRIMRALRFAAELDFEIEEETLKAIEKKSGDLKKISAERIQTELVKLLCSDHPEKVLGLYETGMSKVILPELDAIMETGQNNPHHMYNVGMHTIEAIKYSRKWNDSLSENDKKILRLTMLFHDMGKAHCKTTDENGIDHFKGHADISEKIAGDILRRLKFDNDTINKVKKLVKYHDHRYSVTKVKMRELMVNMGVDLMPLWFAVRRCDTNAQSLYVREEKLSSIDYCEELYNEILRDKDCLSLKDLAVKGKDLIDMGIKPGKELGEALDRMFKLVLEDPSKNDKSCLLSDKELVYGKAAPGQLERMIDE